MSNPALSQETIDTVKATIPFLQENGTKLTEVFYKKLFTKHPEVKAYFNPANQESGVQQRALGGAICAFAQNIETPGNLVDAVSRIANKHASLGVQPEHYPVVGENLLAAIDELLDPAPPEILKAWGEAYGFLADVLIGAEKGLYEEQKKPEGGWSGFRRMSVYRKEVESDVITSFYLRPEDPCPVIPFRPGQYLTVRVPTGVDEPPTTMRNYSLSGSCEWDHYRISVKRDGFVSTYLHKAVATGDVLEIGPPCGDFYLQSSQPESPVLLIAGGVGVTPLLSMLHSRGNNPTTLIHAVIDGKHHAMKEEVRQLAAENMAITAHFRYSEPLESDTDHDSEGVLDEALLSEFLTADTDVYFCGPKPMMKLVYSLLEQRNHPADKIHYEFFGPEQDLLG